VCRDLWVARRQHRVPWVLGCPLSHVWVSRWVFVVSYASETEICLKRSKLGHPVELHDSVHINQSIKSSKRHTSTREATSQRNHTGSKTHDAKRRRLGGLRASRASASFCVTRSLFTRFYRSAQKTAEENHLRCIIFLKEEEGDPGP